ncbi:MAG: bifunctional N-acetylglucosamine-1-phosphate uridyltransferase/glucosamine-1-phosphate acetyltransferase [Desulfobulbaceae bacterium]|nr:bifunctional N-acetylglucosamine-1-phosphate uridyltransferase/glucosamine-1-phosphate acetyltransferase [Desulfobulbaceae bacterium]
MTESIGAIVLAAGKGTRMKSAQAKVLHHIFFRPMLHHVLEAVLAATMERIVVVIGHQQEAVQGILSGFPVETVLQEEQRGTGHAVLCAEAGCAGMSEILILCGDTPLVRTETLSAMLAQHRQEQPVLTVMSTELAQPFGYGRILRSAEGQVEAIVEEKDASEEQRAIREINAGIYLADADFLFTALRQVGTNNSQGEVYLTDIVAIARRENKRVHPFFHPHALDVLGVNSRVELAQAEAALQERRNFELMRAGVTMLNPATIRVAPDCNIGEDCVLHGQVNIEGECSLGRGCVLEQGVVLRDCRLGAAVRVGANSVIIGRHVADGAIIAPLSRNL